MFIGEYTHAVDSKHRLSLPIKFRKELGKQVIITPGLDGCLFVFTLKQWQKISEKLSSSSMLQSNARSFNRYVFAGAVESDVDAIGRVLIPDFLRQHASIENTAVVIGVQDRVELWNEKSWQSYKRVVEKEADTLAEKLGEVGII